MRKSISSAALLLVACVSGCGGSGGGAASGGGSGGGGVTTLSTFDQVVPGSAMTWDTSRSGAFAVTVTNQGGSAAGNAAVRVFTMTMVNQDDGSALEEPVALDLIDTTITNGSGQATFDVRLADGVSEVLLVVTWDDQKASRRVTLGSSVNTVAVSTAL